MDLGTALSLPTRPMATSRAVRPIGAGGTTIAASRVPDSLKVGSSGVASWARRGTKLRRVGKSPEKRSKT